MSQAGSRQVGSIRDRLRQAYSQGTAMLPNCPWLPNLPHAQPGVMCRLAPPPLPALHLLYARLGREPYPAEAERLTVHSEAYPQSSVRVGGTATGAWSWKRGRRRLTALGGEVGVGGERMLRSTERLAWLAWLKELSDPPGDS